MAITKKNVNDAGKVLRELKPELFDPSKFVLNVSKNPRTRWVTFSDAIQLITALPSKQAQAFKNKITEIITRYLSGDKSLIREIESNGESQASINVAARASLEGHMDEEEFMDIESVCKRTCRTNAVEMLAMFEQKSKGFEMDVTLMEREVEAYSKRVGMQPELSKFKLELKEKELKNTTALKEKEFEATKIMKEKELENAKVLNQKELEAMAEMEVKKIKMECALRIKRAEIEFEAEKQMKALRKPTPKKPKSTPKEKGDGGMDVDTESDEANATATAIATATATSSDDDKTTEDNDLDENAVDVPLQPSPPAVDSRKYRPRSSQTILPFILSAISRIPKPPVYLTTKMMFEIQAATATDKGWNSYANPATLSKGLLLFDGIKTTRKASERGFVFDWSVVQSGLKEQGRFVCEAWLLPALREMLPRGSASPAPPAPQQ